jgi:putative aminopeptidase FrvX
VPERWKSVRIHAVSVPALFSQTPVETVDARDVGGLSSLLDSVAGFAGGRPTTAAGASTLEVPAADADGPGDRTDGAAVSNEGLDRTFRTLSTLIETYGVSGHEAPVREAITKMLPAWARPQVDARGNLTVSFGSGGRPLVFVAHMDEVGFEITAIEEDGSARVRTRGGMYLSLYEAHPVVVLTPRGHVAGVMSPRRDYASAVESQPALDRLAIYFGTGSAAETRALGVDAGQSATIRKAFATLGPDRATGRSMDDRAGCAALILALHQIDPAAVQNPVTFAWVVEEETGLGGASFMAGGGMKVHTAFAVDTFVATDTPVDVQRVGAARLGQGAVLRGLDSRTLVRPEVIDRIVGLAREASIPLQIGMTSGGTDASAFSASGAIDAGLSWPGKYSHSPVEVLDRRDLDNLVKLIVTLARSY